MSKLKNQYLKLKDAALGRAWVKEVNVPAKSSLAYILINVIAKAAALIFTPIFTRLLSPAEYGEYSLFSSYLSLALAIGSLELSSGVIMRAYQRSRERRSLTFLSASLLCLAVTAPSCIIIYLIGGFAGGGLSFPFAYTFLFISTVSSTVINLYLSKCRYVYKWIPSLIATVIQSIIAPICSISVIELAMMKSESHVGAKIGTITLFMAASATVMIAKAVIEARKEIKSEGLNYAGAIAYARDTARFLLKMALPLLPYYFSIMIISQADKVLISTFLGKGELGKYSVAYSAGISLNAITAGLCGALCPWIMRKIRANELTCVKRVLGAIISICVSVIICFLALVPDVFKILAPAEYYSALPVAFIASLIPIPLALTQCMSSIAIAKERIGAVVICGAIPAILCVTLNRILIPSLSATRGATLGATVGAIITALSYVCLFVLSLINVSRLMKNSPVSLMSFLRSLLLLALVSASLYVFRSIIAVRLIIGIFGAASLVYNFKNSVALLRDK